MTWKLQLLPTLKGRCQLRHLDLVKWMGTWKRGILVDTYISSYTAVSCPLSNLLKCGSTLALWRGGNYTLKIVFFTLYEITLLIYILRNIFCSVMVTIKTYYKQFIRKIYIEKYKHPSLGSVIIYKHL